MNTHRIAVDAPPTVVALEDPLQDQVQRLALLVAFEAPLGEADRRLDEVRPGAGREAAVDLLEARQEARHRDGAVADVEHLRSGIAEVDDELLHLAEPRCRDAEEAVEHRGGAARLVDEREAASGRARQRAFRDESRESSAEQSIDGVPALAQDARASLGRQRMTGCDGASHRRRVLRLDAREAASRR